MRIEAKKSLGQNFLIDDNVIKNIVNSGEINEDDIILEVGPGTGNLTTEILRKKPKKLILVEKDKKLYEALKNKFGKKVEIFNDDILNCYDNFRLEKPLKIFGNLPYNISTKLLSSWIKIDELNKFYNKFILVFQKEVADRIIAKDNTRNYGRLSILSSWKLNKKKIFDISPNCFNPIPKVWSSLLVLEPKTTYFKLNNSKHLEHITNIFFQQRRKMIKKPLSNLFRDYEKIANKLNLDLNLRPQNISDYKYYEICKIYESLN